MSPSRFVNAARCRSSGALGKQGPSLRKQRPRHSFVQSSTKVSLYLRARSIRMSPGNSFRRPASKLGLSMNNGTLSQIQVPTRNKHVPMHIHRSQVVPSCYGLRVSSLLDLWTFAALHKSSRSLNERNLSEGIGTLKRPSMAAL